MTSTLHPVHDACVEPPCASHRCAAIRPRCVAARARSRATTSVRPASGASSARASASIATIEAKPTSYRRICPTAYAPSEETLVAKKAPSYLAGPGAHGGVECVAAHTLRGRVAGGVAQRGGAGMRPQYMGELSSPLSKRAPCIVPAAESR